MCGFMARCQPMILLPIARLASAGGTSHSVASEVRRGSKARKSRPQGRPALGQVHEGARLRPELPIGIRAWLRLEERANALEFP